MRAIETLAVAIPLFLLVFASTYLMMANAQAQAFTEPPSKTNALYFTVIATVGFGDITPKTEAARVAAMVQVIADLVAVGLVARVIVGAVKAGQQQRSADTGAGDASAEEVSGVPPANEP